MKEIKIFPTTTCLMTAILLIFLISGALAGENTGVDDRVQIKAFADIFATGDAIPVNNTTVERTHESNVTRPAQKLDFPSQLDPIMLTPNEIQVEGCPCEEYAYQFYVWNNTGYDTEVDLSYDLVEGNGTCQGPASVFVPEGENLPIMVELFPMGDFGDLVVCQIFAEDASDAENNDTSWIIKTLVNNCFDPAGWQLENNDGALSNFWASGAVGTNPAADGEVGYYLGGATDDYPVGGTTEPRGILDNLQMYDPGTDEWTQLAAMPNPGFTTVVGWIDGLLYAANGFDFDWVVTNDLRVYDPVTDTWDNTSLPSMPNDRGGGNGGVGLCNSGVGECLFHVGGAPDNYFHNTTLETWQYDPNDAKWIQLDDKPPGSSPNGHFLGAGVGCLGYIFIGGDYRGYHEFYRLDATQPPGWQWTQLANIPPLAGAMTPALVCMENLGAIVLIGGDPFGWWSGVYNDTVYIYDIASDSWEGPLPQTLNVNQLGSVGLHMHDRVWTFAGTINLDPIVPVPHESLEHIICEGCSLSHVQIAHLAPFADDTSITITLNGEEVLSDFAYGDSTAYNMLVSGEYDVAVIPTGFTDPVIEVSVTLEIDTYYTIIAIGDGVNQDLDLILMEDDLTEPADGKFHLRLGHLAPFAPGLATADIRLQDGTPVLLDVNFGDVTGFIPLDAGIYDLIITTPGGEVTLIDALPVDFAESMVISAFASGDGVNQDLGIFGLPTGVEGFFLPLGEYGVELIAEEDALFGGPAIMVEYTLSLTNTGNIPDTFELSFEDNLWDVHLPQTSFQLEPSESVEVIVLVTIPAEAGDGDSDMVKNTATSDGDVEQKASVTLMTTAVVEISEPEMFYLFTPLVVKN